MWLDAILEELTTEEPATFEDERHWTWGCAQQRARLAWIAEYCAKRWQGDFAEIGCYTGGGTMMLAKTARRYGRRIIAIDPWQPGTQDCRGNEYEIFLRNIEPYQDIVDVVRLPSQDARAIDALTNARLCFAIIDGLHTYEAALSDIKAVSHARVIAVDDALSYNDVRRAVVIGAGATNKKVVAHHLCREIYLLPSKKRIEKA